MTQSDLNVMLATRWSDSLTPFAKITPGAPQPHLATVRMLLPGKITEITFDIQFEIGSNKKTQGHQWITSIDICSEGINRLRNSDLVVTN